MTALHSQKNKKIGIFGLGKTGSSAYKALEAQAQIVAYDDNLQNREAFIAQFGEGNLADLQSPRWQALDKIVLSPGVPLDHEIVSLARIHNIPITSDIDLFFEEISVTLPLIAVTGTNGKSTTAALITHILQRISSNFALGGNIGTPILTLPRNKDGYVLELSSFQLDLIKSFKATIAVLLNITPDHLERHHTMENYIHSKEKIFANLDENGIAVIGIDNEISRGLYNKYQKAGKFKVIPISAFDLMPGGVATLEHGIEDDMFNQISITFPENKYLSGLHNCENIAAAYAVCRALDVTPEDIIAGISSFKGLPHRMQYLGEKEGINFYNDSKATNAQAASKSLGSLKNIYWLAGGIAKEGGIAQLEPLFTRVKKAYFFGRDKELFANQLKGQVQFQICADLNEAFAAAYADTLKDDITHLKNILLAPASASYDQFKNFEERGELFIKLAKQKIAT